MCEKLSLYHIIVSCVGRSRQISSSVRFAMSIPPRSVTIQPGIAQKSSLYYIHTIFDRHRRATCRKLPLRAHKKRRFHPLSARREYPPRHTAHTRPQADVKISEEYSTQKPTDYSTRYSTEYSTGAKLQIAFIFPAKRLHFTLIQPRTKFPFLDIVSFNGTDITLQLLSLTAIDKEQNGRFYYSKSRLLGSQKTLFVNYLFTKLS